MITFINRCKRLLRKLVVRQKRVVIVMDGQVIYDELQKVSRRWQ